MDYIFRWIEVRFPSGDQLPLVDAPVGSKPKDTGDISSLATSPVGFEDTYVPGDAQP
jgi:hypothetical protein